VISEPITGWQNLAAIWQNLAGDAPQHCYNSSNLGSIVALKLIIDINTAYLVIVVNREPRKC